MTASSSYTDVLIRIRAGTESECRVEISVNGADPEYGTLPLNDHDEKSTDEELNAAKPESAYGALLFAKLFSDEKALKAYYEAIGKERPLRIRLWIEEEVRTKIAHWKWECLWDEAGPIATNADRPFSRYIEIGGKTTFEPLTTDELRILVTLANPKLPKFDKIEVEENVKSLLTFLAPPSKGPRLKVTLMPGHSGLSDEVKHQVEEAGWTIFDGPTSQDNVQTQLSLSAPHNYHIWHHIGHGSRMTRENPSPEVPAEFTTLYLESSSGDSGEAWPDYKIEKFIEPLAVKPYLVFLNACEGAEQQSYDKDPRFGMGPKLVTAGVPAVVAMQHQVRFDIVEAIQVFYRQLLSHGVVDVALNEARHLIKHREKDRIQFDWTIPVLFMRSQNGRLFVLDQMRNLLRHQFDEIIENRLKLFGGRNTILREMEKIVHGSDGGYLVVHGPAGFGKTALMAEFVTPTPPHFAYHFFDPHGPEECLNKSAFFLRNVVQQMAIWHDWNQELPHPDEVDELKALYNKFIGTELPTPHVLVLDGLDEVTNWKLSDYLNRELPSNLHIVATVRDTGQNWQQDYQTPKDQCIALPLDGLTPNEIEQVFQAAGPRAAQLVADPDACKQIVAIAAYEAHPELGADPFYVRLLAEDAARPEEKGGLTAASLRSPHLSGLSAYLEDWLNSILGAAETAKHAQAVQDLIGTLTVTLGPISRQDLEAFNPSLRGGGLVKTFPKALAEVRRFVVGDDNGYSLMHPRLAQYMRTHPNLDISGYLENILAHCRHYQEQGWSEETPDYILNHYVRHLSAKVADDTKAYEVLKSLFLTDEWMHARVERSHFMYGEYLEDVHRAWNAAEHMRDIGFQIRCALIKASVNSLSAAIPHQLIVALVSTGEWDLEQGMESMHMIPDPKECAEGLVALASTLPDEDQYRVYRAAVKSAREIPNPEKRARTLASLAPLVPVALKKEVMAEAIKSAKLTERKWIQVDIWIEIAQLLPPQERESLLSKAMDTALSIDERDLFDRGQAYLAIAPQASEQILSDIVNHGLQHGFGYNADAKFKSLVKHLPTDTLLLETYRAVIDSYTKIDQGEWLAAMAPYLPDHCLSELLDTTFSLEENYKAIPILKALAPRLTEDQLGDVLERIRITQKHSLFYSLIPILLRHKSLVPEAYDVAIEMEEGEGARALVALIPALSVLHQQSLLQEIRSNSRDWYRKLTRAQVLVALLPWLTGKKTVKEVADVALKWLLDETPWKWDEPLHAETLLNLAEFLQGSSRDKAISQALHILQDLEKFHTSHMRHCTRLLARLAVMLPEPKQQQQVSIKAVQAFGKIYSKRDRDAALPDLLGHLPQGFLKQAVQILQTVRDEIHSTKVLAALISWLPEEVRQDWISQVLQMALNLKNKRWSATSLTLLAPYLSGSELEDAVTAAYELDDPIFVHKSGIAEVLTALVHNPNLSEPERRNAIQKAFEYALSDFGEGSSSIRGLEILTSLVCQLSENLLELAWEKALPPLSDGREMERWHLNLFSILAPHLSSTCIEKSLRYAWRLFHFGALHSRDFFTALAPHLSESQMLEALDPAWLPAWIEYRNDKHNSVVEVLAPHVPSTLITETLQASGSNYDQIVSILAPRMSQEQLIEALNNEENSHHNPIHYSRALTAIALQLPEPQRRDAIMKAYEAAWNIDARWLDEDNNEKQRIDALLPLIPHLPQEHKESALSKILTVALAKKDANVFSPEWRAKVLTSVVPYVPNFEHHHVLVEAFSAIKSISFSRTKIDPLSQLAPHLSEPLMSEALQWVDKETLYREELLECLTPYLTDSSLPDALSIAHRVRDFRDVAEYLKFLAPRLATLPDETLCKTWNDELRFLSKGTRYQLLYALEAMAPVIERLGGPKAFCPLYDSTRDVIQWWP